MSHDLHILRVQGSGFRVSVFGFRFSGSGCGVSATGCRFGVSAVGFRVQGFKVSGSVFRKGEGFRIRGNHFTEICCGTEAGSYLRLIDSCVTQLKAQGPSKTCNESKEEGSGHTRRRGSRPRRAPPPPRPSSPVIHI